MVKRAAALEFLSDFVEKRPVKLFKPRKFFKKCRDIPGLLDSAMALAPVTPKSTLVDGPGSSFYTMRVTVTIDLFESYESCFDVAETVLDTPSTESVHDSPEYCDVPFAADSAPVFTWC